MHHDLYFYKLVELHNVVDGDTVDCRISYGFGQTGAFRFRVANIDTPEITGRYAEPAGHDAKRFTEAWLRGKLDRLMVQTFKASTATVGIGDGAFGRWLGEFIDKDSGEKLSDALRAAGYVRNRQGVLMHVEPPRE